MANIDMYHRRQDMLLLCIIDYVLSINIVHPLYIDTLITNNNTYIYIICIA